MLNFVFLEKGLGIFLEKGLDSPHFVYNFQEKCVMLYSINRRNFIVSLPLLPEI